MKCAQEYAKSVLNDVLYLLCLKLRYWKNQCIW